MTTEVLTPTMLYTLLAGIAVAWIIERLKAWPAVAWLKPESSKFKKAGIALIGSLLAQLIPALIALATKQTQPDWAALGSYAWSALLQWIVASGAWAILLKKASTSTATE